VEEAYSVYCLNEIGMKLKKSEELKEVEISENEFISTSDLANKQLYEFGNYISVPSSLIPSAMKYLVTFITNKFIRHTISRSN
jgi:hypothetical protein